MDTIDQSLTTDFVIKVLRVAANLFRQVYCCRLVRTLSISDSISVLRVFCVLDKGTNCLVPSKRNTWKCLLPSIRSSVGCLARGLTEYTPVLVPKGVFSGSTRPRLCERLWTKLRASPSVIGGSPSSGDLIFRILTLFLRKPSASRSVGIV
jgi:hypothetical protein